jgi:hypothetical protein
LWFLGWGVERLHEFSLSKMNTFFYYYCLDLKKLGRIRLVINSRNYDELTY